MEAILTKQNLIIFAVIVLALGVVYWCMRSRTPMTMEEAFEESFQEAVQENVQMETDKNVPFVDAKTGSIMDGPGFERGDGNVDGVTQEIVSKVPSNMYFLDDGANGAMSIQHNLFSKSCCSEQWPTPFKQKWDPYVCGKKDQYVATNYFGNNSFQDSGCLCATKEQSHFITKRGNNAVPWY